MRAHLSLSKRMGLEAVGVIHQEADAGHELLSWLGESCTCMYASTDEANWENLAWTARNIPSSLAV